MQAEIIATGSELTLGEQVDTNSPHIARKLREIGLGSRFITAVGDDEPALVEAVRIALSRSEVVVIGGGLGPTVDDVTRPAVARAVGRSLVFRPELLAQIAARFKAYGRTMSDNNRQQAYVPEDAIPIENPVGTAPAFIVEHEGRAIACLPGVPREMMHLLDHAVLPYLAAKFDLREVILVRTLHTVGEGESRIDQAIADLEQSANPVIGLSAKSGQVDVRITSRAAGRDAAQKMIAEMETKVRERIDEHIFGADEQTLEGVIADLLANRHSALATVELNTGGAISSRLNAQDPSIRKAGQVFQGGLVLSDASSLPSTLNVDVRSAENLAMITRAAQRIRAIHRTPLGLGAMLVDSGDGPSMRIYAALVSDAGAETLERSYGGHAGLAPQWTSSLALGMVWRFLTGASARRDGRA